MIAAVFFGTIGAIVVLAVVWGIAHSQGIKQQRERDEPVIELLSDLLNENDDSAIVSLLEKCPEFSIQKSSNYTITWRLELNGVAVKDSSLRRCYARLKHVRTAEVPELSEGNLYD
jgi:hypothetical protein